MKTLKGYAYDARTVEALQAVDEPGVYQFFGMRGKTDCSRNCGRKNAWKQIISESGLSYDIAERKK